MKLNWKNPPPDQPTQAQLVGEALKANPGEWALIAEDHPYTIFPWWAPLTREGAPFEVRVKRKPGSTVFGPSDVYARYNGFKSRPIPQPPRSDQGNPL